MAHFSIEHAQDNAPANCDPWLTPKAVSAMTGFDTTWLAAAREGRKEVRGPEYVKIGTARTSPVRYRYSAVLAWMASFQVQSTTTMYRETGPWPPSVMIAHEMAVLDQPGTFPGTGPVPTARTFKEWLNNSSDGSALWLIADTPLGPMDAFQAMAACGKPEQALDDVRWVSREDWDALKP